MKDDYKKAVQAFGRLKCPECGNTNLRKMYSECSVIATQNLVSGEITIPKRPYKMADNYNSVFCSICETEIKDNRWDYTDPNKPESKQWLKIQEDKL